MKGIYKFTNKINNKVYIGKSQHLEVRYNEHRRNHINPNDTAYNTKFYQGLRKYGFDNFDYEVLVQSNTFSDDDLNELEIYYIQEYDSINSGYNIQKGGKNTAVPRKLNKEQIIEIKEALKNSDINFRDIAKQMQVSESLITMINQGITWSMVGDYIYPIREKTTNHQGGKNPKAKIIDEEVMSLRKYFVDHTLDEVYAKFGQNHSYSEIKKICYGCQFQHLPVYKKRPKQWMLGNTCIDYPR